MLSCPCKIPTGKRKIILKDESNNDNKSNLGIDVGLSNANGDDDGFLTFWVRGLSFNESSILRSSISGLLGVDKDHTKLF